MTLTEHDILISAQTLADCINKPDVIVLDASVAPPGSAPDKNQAICTISGARRFDIDTVFSDISSSLPHTLINSDSFTAKARAIGINKDSVIVVFDHSGLFSAPRAWWMFRAMGHHKVYILNGGLPAWQHAGFDCDDHYDTTNKEGDFQARLQDQWFVDMTCVEQAVADHSATVIDARSADRFNGHVDEPRPGLRRGNIPGSLNLPFENLLQQGCYKTTLEIQQQFQALKIDKNQPLYFSCGSGVTACIDAVAALLIGFEQVSVYDGSWTEWATRKP